MLSGVVARRDPVKDADFSTDGPDFVYEHFDEMEKEAPKTNNLIQTGDLIDDMDGWISGEGSQAYYDALEKDLKQINEIYQSETTNVH